jgi:stage II sporulation protein AB (anti-sigma F factor)
MSRKEITFEFDSDSENESLARTVVAAFMARLDPTLEEMADVKTAVSEAVTNAIIHGYDGEPGKVWIHSWIEKNTIWIEVTDEGVGIADVSRAMEPLYTTRPELERSGMGFAFMEAFMDELHVDSQVGKGTTIRMKKKIYSAFAVIGESADGNHRTD